MRRTTRGIALALTAVAVAAPVAVTDAKRKKPKPPSTATIKKVLKRTYCAPETNKPVTVTFQSIKRGKPRVGDPVYEGTPANRRTIVFPVRAKYFCDYRYTNNSTPDFKAPDVRIKGDYIFYRDESGSWVQRNKKHDAETVPGNN